MVGACGDKRPSGEALEPSLRTSRATSLLSHQKPEEGLQGCGAAGLGPLWQPLLTLNTITMIVFTRANRNQRARQR